MLTKTKGVILRAIDIKEADRILEIYTDDLGKIRAVARGVRKISSRLAGHLEPFTYVDLMLAQGRGDLPTITGAKALEHYPALRRDLGRVAPAAYISELVSKLTPDGQGSKRFPDLIRYALRGLDTDSDPRRVVSYYEWQAILVGGWQPSLHSCVGCGQKLYPQDLSFSVAMSGILCKQCTQEDPEAVSVSPEAVKLLRCYSEMPFVDVEGLLVTEAVRKETTHLTDLLVRYLLSREPRSKAFLRHVETV